MLAIAPRPGGGSVLIVGLSAENVRRLRANEPIQHDLRPHGLAIELVIFGGRGDESDLRARLAEVATLPPEASP